MKYWLQLFKLYNFNGAFIVVGLEVIWGDRSCVFIVIVIKRAKYSFIVYKQFFQSPPIIETLALSLYERVVQRYPSKAGRTKKHMKFIKGNLLHSNSMRSLRKDQSTFVRRKKIRFGMIIYRSNFFVLRFLSVSGEFIVVFLHHNIWTFFECAAFTTMRIASKNSTFRELCPMKQTTNKWNSLKNEGRNSFFWQTQKRPEASSMHFHLLQWSLLVSVFQTSKGTSQINTSTYTGFEQFYQINASLSTLQLSCTLIKVYFKFSSSTRRSKVKQQVQQQLTRVKQEARWTRTLKALSVLCRRWLRGDV